MGSSDRSIILSTTTPSFGWPVPTSGDLVKNGATAIEALGDAIDSSMTDLKGGTTGQVLSKTSNTDMDFTWVAADDTNAIQNTIVDAKGDLIAASAADTPARLAVGSNGETLVADSSTSTGLRYTQNFAAGKNKIINGDFSIAQRGASRSLAFAFQYIQDRWNQNTDSGPTGTVSQTAFTPGAAPVAGYEGQFFLNFNMTAITGGSFYVFAANRMEDVRTLAGQTATISFWAKADSTRTIGVKVNQNFGSGGSSGVVTTATTTLALSTSWTRYTYTVSIPSISGKTIGSGSYLELEFTLGSLVVQQINLWGVQLEAGSVATAFQTATGTIQGELAACQRYYWRQSSDATTLYADLGVGSAGNTTTANIYIKNPVSMRISPSILDYANLAVDDGVTTTAVTSATISNVLSNSNGVNIAAVVASGLTQYRPYRLLTNNTASGYVGISAEL
jgi:hypothetical protein